MNVQEYLPKDKFDEKNIPELFSVSDDELKPVIPELLKWLQDYNYPVAQKLLPYLQQREDLVFPYVSGILRSDDTMWKIWVMELLIPYFNHLHRNMLKEQILTLTKLQIKNEDDAAIVDSARSCYAVCFHENTECP